MIKSPAAPAHSRAWLARRVGLGLLVLAMMDAATALTAVKETDGMANLAPASSAVSSLTVWKKRVVLYMT